MDSRTIFWIGYTILVILLFITMFSKMTKIVDEVSFYQKYYSEDISLVEQAVMFAPYEVSYLYQLDENYEIVFEEKCSVNVFEKNTPVMSGHISFCTPNDFLNVNYPQGIVKNKSLLIYKYFEDFGVV